MTHTNIQSNSSRPNGVSMEDVHQTDYKLMQTSLDRPQIMQVHRFMDHSKISCFDLQFVALCDAVLIRICILAPPSARVARTGMRC